MKGTDKGCGSSWDGGNRDEGLQQRESLMKFLPTKGVVLLGMGVIGMKGSSKGCGSCGDGVTVWFEGFRVLSKGVVHLLMG